MKVSVVIPARNEMFLARTIEDLLEHSGEETEIIAVLDGAWANPPIPQHPRVNVIYVPESVGQRAATNLGAKMARGKYIAKCDAHCAFAPGWDAEMIRFFEEQGGDIIAVPIMRNLWAFDWKCYHCGWKKYQGPTPTVCDNCKKGDKMRRKMMWIGKERPQSWSYSFDAEPHFQYFEEYKKRPATREMTKQGYSETMSLQGSFFMSTLANYWRLKLSDEALGNWGNQGIELACKMWLSGGRVLVNHRTWYAHMFRTQGAEFGFPYPQSGHDVQRTKKMVVDDVWGQKLVGQIYPVSWLVQRFWPVPGWSENNLRKLLEFEAAIPNSLSK